MDSNIVIPEIVIVSWWAFTAWWCVFLALHLVTCGYNVMFALFYWELEQTTLCWYLVFYHIGMAPENYRIIAAAHALMASVQGLCALSMVGSSLWFRTLTFTPWDGPSVVSKVNPELKMIKQIPGNQSSRTKTMMINGISKLGMQITNRYGILGVNGKYFHVLLLCRELIETTFETIQAYRMSYYLPNILLNRFYVIGLVLNCWSSAIIYTLPIHRDETRKRLASLACDCALDLMACMGVTFIVVHNYLDQYVPNSDDFQLDKWYNDEWVARALNEFQMIVVVSWTDLFSRVIFTLGLVATTTNMKEILYLSSRHRNRVTTAPQPAPIPPKQVKVKAVVKNEDDAISKVPCPTNQVSETNGGLFKKLRCRGHGLMYGVHTLLFFWGFLVLGFHIQAAMQPTLSQCLLQVRPWAVFQPSCFLLSLDCNSLAITGQLDEVDTNSHEFDGSTVAIMLIKHCQSLNVPDIFSEFHQLISIKIYNTTIVEWSESAAITNTNHPVLLSLMLARVNMSQGLLPIGFQSSDTPVNLYDFELCFTNLRELPDDLDSKWNPGSVVLIEYSQLQSVPVALLRIQPTYLSLVGNPISELPPEIFEVEGMTDLVIGYTKIHEFPRNVPQFSSTLSTIYIHGTDISYFWPWIEVLIDRQSVRWMPRPIMAGDSIYCNDLQKIEKGSTNNFSVPVSSDYSLKLMNATNADPGGSIWSWVDCNPAVSGDTGPLFPLDSEDNRSAAH